MKKIVFFTFIFTMFFYFTACGGNNSASTRNSNVSNVSQDSTQKSQINGNAIEKGNEKEAKSDRKTDNSNKNKILVAYFSRVGNTNFDANVDVISSASLSKENGDLVGNMQVMADMIVKRTGGDKFLIKTVDTYPTDYRDTTNKAQDEKLKNERPALSSHVENINDYDIIFLGYPNWWGTIPMPLYTFLEENNFSGKTIIPFCSHEGSGLGSGVSDIKKLCPDAVLLNGLAVRGFDVKGSQNKINDWINGLGVIK